MLVAHFTEVRLLDSIHLHLVFELFMPFHTGGGAEEED